MLEKSIPVIGEVMLDKQKYSYHDVAAIITSMTDAEQPFLHDTLEAVLSDPGIGQVILCIEENNTWIDTAIGQLGTDLRLEIVRIPLMPLGAVRNQALKRVHLPWVAYCDGDDVWCHGKTQHQRAYANTTGCDFVGSDHYLTNESGRIRAVALARYLPMPSSWMAKTEVMQKHPFHELPFSLSQDESGEWWMRTNGLVSKTRCPKLLLRYRIRSSSLSTKTPSMQRKTKIVTLANNPGFRAVILLVTWIFWLLTRQDKYIWYKGWDQPVADIQDK